MPEKQRSSGEVPLHTYWDSYDLSGHYLSSFSEDRLEPPSFYEYISYENGRSSFNPCFHFKRLIVNHGPTSSFIRTLPDHYEVQHGNMSMRTTCPWDTVPEPPSPKLGQKQFILRAFQHSIPKLKADVSVPNFIYELKDLLHTLPSRERVRQLADICRLAKGNPFRASKRYKRKRLTAAGSLNELKDELAQQHLSANFGYLPLINDVFNIVGSMKEFNLRLSQFKKTISKGHIFHYSEMADNVSTGPITTAVGSAKYYYTLDFTNVRWRCTLLGSLSADLRNLAIPSVLRKYFGFRSNPRILWDAIPYSFLVDWISNFGKFLERYDRGAIPASLHVNGVGLSVQYRARLTLYVENISHTYSFDTLEVGSIEWNVYKRWPVLDFDARDLENLPPLPTLHGLDFNQVTLGLALANNFVGKSRG